MTPTRRVIIALAAGVAGGLAISASQDARLLSIASFVEPVGKLWVNAIRMTVVPLVVSLLIVSVASVESAGALGRIGVRSLVVFATMLLSAAVAAAFLAPALFGMMPTGLGRPAVSDSVAVTARAAAEGARNLPSFGEWLAALVPVNPVRAAADGDMLPLVIFSILFALASASTAQAVRQPLISFFRAVGESMLILVRWIIVLAPIGVFAIILPLAARIGASAAGALGYLILVVCGMLTLELLILYVVAVSIGRVPLRTFARAVLPAQVVAFTTRSSLASLPALIDSARKNLKLPEPVTGFVLPMAVSIFKISAPVTWIANAVFLSHFYGVPLGPREIAILAALSIVLSFGSPGIPGGSVIMAAPLYASFGLPVEGIGILIAIDFLPDIFKTVTNVTADMTAATIIAREPPSG
jgi:proton glutamate symport protein